MNSPDNKLTYVHGSTHSLGVLITNLGTTAAPTVPAIRAFLKEFLSDTRVIELNPLLWSIILHGVILPFRPKKILHAYQSIWTAQGSPLMAISCAQQVALESRLQAQLGKHVKVVLGMRYGKPSLADALQMLADAGVRRLLVLPLYPQYSSTTTASTFDAIAQIFRQWRWLPDVRFVMQYHDHPAYINALAQSISSHWQQHRQPDKLLFSFHGLPKENLLKGDPYYCQSVKTARLVAQQLQLADGQWAVSFQSRVGPKEWLQPYTEQLLKKWGSEGIGHVQLVCPGFAADCLETLEEIAMQNRDFFLQAGGKEYGYIPALNAESGHIEALSKIVLEQLQGWPEASNDWPVQQMLDEEKQHHDRWLAQVDDNVYTKSLP